MYVIFINLLYIVAYYVQPDHTFFFHPLFFLRVNFGVVKWAVCSENKSGENSIILAMLK